MTVTALRALPVPETEPAIEQQEAERSDWFRRDPQYCSPGVQGASAGEVIPNRIPVSRAVDVLCLEYAEAQARDPRRQR